MKGLKELKRLKELFAGFMPRPETQCRVFLIEDEKMLAAAREICRVEEKHMFSAMLIAAGTGDEHGGAPATRAAIEALVGWPRDINMWVREQGYRRQVPGPDLVPAEGNVYLIAPDAEYLAARGGDNTRLGLEIASRWAPPPGLQEQRKDLFGPAPQGITRCMSASSGRICALPRMRKG